MGARHKPTALSIFAKGPAATPSNRSGVLAQDAGDGGLVVAGTHGHGDWQIKLG